MVAGLTATFEQVLPAGLAAEVPKAGVLARYWPQLGPLCQNH